MVRNSYHAEFCSDRMPHRNLMVALGDSISKTVRIWWATRRLSADIMREREELAGLSDSLLRDIGIGRAEASAESNRSADDLPLDRLREVCERC